MGLLPTCQIFVDEFLAAIAPFEVAFKDAGFSYLALKFGERFIIKQGRLFLYTYAPKAQSKHFRSVRVRAGYYPLAELKLDLRGFIERLLGGELQTPDGVLHFPAAEGGHHAASYVPFHPVGLQTQLRFNYLTLMGGQMEPLRQPEIDWEIKAATSPYDGIQELANEFHLGVLTGDTINVGLIAYNVAAIDAEKSGVDGTNADVHVLLARGLPTDGVVLGYRSYARGVNLARGTLSGQAMQWTEEPGCQRGRAAIQVVNAAVLNCTISYAGVAQAHFWPPIRQGFKTHGGPSTKHLIQSSRTFKRLSPGRRAEDRMPAIWKRPWPGSHGCWALVSRILEPYPKRRTPPIW